MILLINNNLFDLLKDTYYAIKAQTTGELKVLGSRFIGNAFPVSEKDEAENHINTIEIGRASCRERV